MSTLVISDLHLGTRSGADLLRHAANRRPLLDALVGVDRVVLLGDAVELRHGPLRAQLELARPFFQELGEALGSGQVVLAPGNHDHDLIGGWLAGRRFEGAPPPLAPEQRISPVEASDAACLLERWLGAARFELAYPGLWLRPDVYATHGHYLDRHLTVPTLERLVVGVMGRVVRAAGARPGADGYEARVAPIYAWLRAVAEHAGGRAVAGGADVSARVWHGLGGGGHWGLGTRMLVRALLPLAVAVINRLGVGPLRADVSGEELRRAGLRAITAVAGELGIDAPYVIFGHTHRPGPLASDDPAEWRAGADVRLLNAGSWIYQRHFLGPDASTSSYWPGCAVLVPDEGEPRLLRLLSDRSHADLSRPAPVPL